MRSVGNGAAWAPGGCPVAFPGLTSAAALLSRLSFKTSRLLCCGLGRAAGCSAWGLTECDPEPPPPVWGMTHGHDPGVPLWARVVGFLRGRWFPFSFWCLFFSLPLVSRGKGNVDIHYKLHLTAGHVRHRVMRARHHALGRRGICY